MEWINEKIKGDGENDIQNTLFMVLTVQRSSFIKQFVIINFYFRLIYLVNLAKLMY